MDNERNDMVVDIFPLFEIAIGSFMCPFCGQTQKVFVRKRELHNWVYRLDNDSFHSYRYLEKYGECSYFEMYCGSKDCIHISERFENYGDLLIFVEKTKIEFTKTKTRRWV